MAAHYPPRQPVKGIVTHFAFNSMTPPNEGGVSAFINSVFRKERTMKIARWKFWAFAAILAATYSAVAQSPTATPTSVDFGSVEIGISSQPRSVTITNPGDKALDLKISFSGPGSSEFFETHENCSKSLASKQSCEIAVRFVPKTGSTQDQPTKSAMEIPGSSSPTVNLQGVGVPSFKMSPEQLAFGNQLVNTSSSPRAVTVTNNTGKAISNIDFTVAGDFTETHTGCVTLNAGASCAISVVFTPKHADSVTGALTVSVKPGDSIVNPKVVSLSGEGVQRCNPVGISCGWGTWTVLIVCGAYFLGMVLVRWNMIARPTRLQLRTQITAVQTRLEEEFAALTRSDAAKTRKQQIEQLLKGAIYVVKTKHDPFDKWQQAPPPWWTRWGNALFWTRGHELAGWSLVHEAEEQLVELLPIERVRARIQTAEQQLRTINNPAALRLADRLRDAIQSGEVILQEKLQQLLAQTSILQQPEVPAAAQQALLSNTLSKILSFVNAFAAWVQASASQATALDACQKILTDFRQKFANWNALLEEAGRLLKLWPAIPPPSQTVLQSAMDFLAGQFAPAYQSAGAQPDLPACNGVLASLAKLQGTAQAIASQLAGLVQQGQDVTALQVFLQKAKSQTDLLTSIEAALTPLQSAELLQQIQTLVDADHTLSQQLTAAAAAATTDDVSKLRAFLEPFAFSLPLAQELAAKVKGELDYTAPAVMKRWRGLLIEALGLIYDRADTDFSHLADWHNKLMWLVTCALIFIFALAITFQNPVLLLLGAVGGLLSRLSQNLQIADVENDYGASWGSIFLSPVTGALSAWGGILLIILGNKLHVLGSALELDWCNPFDPMTLAIALLFGFSERFFDDVAQKVIKTVSAPSSSATAPPSSSTTPAVSPTISSIDPPQVSAGKENKLSVRGINFKAGVSAKFTDQSGKDITANMEFKDANNLVVTLTPPSVTSPYKATLTISNPDGKTATFSIPVQASS
jgi:hypothetical protein